MRRRISIFHAKSISARSDFDSFGSRGNEHAATREDFRRGVLFDLCLSVFICG
jgi:hypothetical protein